MSDDAVAPPLALLGKLHEVAVSIDSVEKRGENKAQHYSYVQAVDVVRAVREKLLARDIIVVPSAGNVCHEDARGGKGMVTTVDLLYRFTDTGTGEYVEVPWVGVGADIGGDKGIYKAMTGGLKYALLSLFLIPTTDDPEGDAQTEPASATSNDAERPAAPTIPADRAYLIAEKAQELGLIKTETAEGAAPSFDFGPVFKAKLATLGVERIGQLNVDQAEDVEAFLANEAETVPVSA